MVNCNKLALNVDETNVINFITNNSRQYALIIGYNIKCIQESVNTEFLLLQIDNHLTWINHIDTLTVQIVHIMQLGLCACQQH